MSPFKGYEDNIHQELEGGEGCQELAVSQKLRVSVKRGVVTDGFKPKLANSCYRWFQA